MNKYTHRWYLVKAWCSNFGHRYADSFEYDLNNENIVGTFKWFIDDNSELASIKSICVNENELNLFKSICEFYFNDCKFEITPLKVEKLNGRSE